METITKERLKTQSKEEITGFIRGYLTNNGEKLKFDMSGESGREDNINILNSFAPFGIFDCYDFLTIDFHKGTGTVLLGNVGRTYEIDYLGGLTTSQIIYEIFKHTILKR